MNKKEEIIQMLERCLSRTDTISYKIFENMWREKLEAVKNDRYIVEVFEPNICYMHDDSYKNSFVYKQFLSSIGTSIRDSQRNWDKEFFKK